MVAAKSPIDISRFEQLKSSGELPSPKGVALAIIRLTQRDDVSMADLARVIKSDPAFVGRLIKAANGVVAHTRRAVASVQDALVVLGMPAVRSLALGFSLLSSFRSGRCRSFDYSSYWSGSLATAIAMQAISVRTRSAGVEETFVVGLLARIGELSLATLFPEEYAHVLDQLASTGVSSLQEAEQRRLGLNHVDLTAAMLSDWGIPPIFVEPVSFHEQPELSGYAENARQAQIVYSLALARAIAAVCLAEEEARPACMPRVLELSSRLGFDEQTTLALCDGVAREWLAWSKLLPVDAREMPPFESLVDAMPAKPNQDVEIARMERNPLRILVVDDDASMRVMLKAVLDRAGHEVQVASDGRQGMDMALDLQPQLMIVDWLMPEMTGIELTRSLRQTKVGRSVYIIILTSLEDEDRLIEAFEGGVDDFITKPLKPRILAARIRAGQRVIKLQQEIERDREEIRRFAAELAVTNRRLQEVALTDALTGFPNRRYAMERIAQDWAASGRSGRPLACMVIDVDEFKQINDAYGHDVGDAVLRQTALALKQGLRAQDVVCRTGGDEFLVICPDTSLDQALACGERVRRAVDAVPIVSGMLELKASISVGVAVRLDDMADAEALIKVADQGLYLAKQRGRNRVAATQS